MPPETRIIGGVAIQKPAWAIYSCELAVRELLGGKPPESPEGVSSFVRDGDDDPYLEGRVIRGMLKEAAKTSSMGQSLPRSSPNRVKFSYFERGVVVEPNRIYLDGSEIIIETVGSDDFECIEETSIEFEIAVLDDLLAPEQWSRIWEVAERVGLGAHRKQGYGKFSLARWERKES